MSDETKQNPRAEPLQFDTAEPVQGSGATATSLACTACSTDITTSYYEVNGAIVCTSCRGTLRTQLTGGSSRKRAAKAVGAAAYGGVVALTGKGFGLLLLLIGFLVGRAVNLGSGQRGGRAYQFLAVGLTYFAVVSTYIPEIVKSAREAAVTVADSSTKSLADKRAGERVSTSVGPQTELQGAPSTPGTAGRTTSPVETPRTFGEHAFRIIVVLALMAFIPVVAAFENILFAVVFGITLFQAWRQNRRVDLVITGPYRIGQLRDGQPSAVVSGG